MAACWAERPGEGPSTVVEGELENGGRDVGDVEVIEVAVHDGRLRCCPRTACVVEGQQWLVEDSWDSGNFYLSFPVSNGLVEYEEYYELTEEELERFSAALVEMRELAELARSRNCDDRLIMKPGSKRGSPI